MGFFCCCLFHFHKETLIHSETNPPFLWVRPKRATSPTSMSLLSSTPARRRQLDSFNTLRGETPGKRVKAFLPTGTPSSTHAPSQHLSTLHSPTGSQLQAWALPGPAVQWHGLLHVRRGRARPLLQMEPGTCARTPCRSFWLCTLCYIPKRTEKVCSHNRLRTRDKSPS